MEVKLQLKIRWLVRRDMPEVLMIDRHSFVDSWSEDEYLHVIRKRNCIAMVAECDDCVVGFVVYELHRRYLELLRFAVDCNMRRMGIGSQLIGKLKSKLHHQHRTFIAAEMPERNHHAVLFLRDLGFRATGVLRERFEDQDAYVMEWRK
jgi:ribosomal-protein-alanine N-acetyltransferase